MIEEDKMIRGLLAYARKHDCKGWREMHYKFTANELHQHYLAFFRELQVKNCSIPDVGRMLLCPHCKGEGEYIDTHPERYGLKTCECQRVK